MIVVSSLSSLTKLGYSYLPSGLLHCIAGLFLAGGAYRDAWLQEFLGTLLMIFLTFSPGKWIGVGSVPLEWLCHAIGVVAADYLAGGPHVNPAMSAAMFCIGKCNFTEAYVRIMGSIAGGLVAFPLFLTFSDSMGWTALGGPQYSLKDEDDDASSAFFNEFASTFLLAMAVYILNFELNFGKNHYWIKQSLTAIVIRYLIVVFSTTGPAMNPMLGTTWLIFSSKATCIEGMEHYFIYWIAPYIAAAVSGFVYIVYAGGEWCGYKLPVGPIKEAKKEEPKKPTDKKKSAKSD